MKSYVFKIAKTMEMQEVEVIKKINRNKIPVE